MVFGQESLRRLFTSEFIRDGTIFALIRVLRMIRFRSAETGVVRTDDLDLIRRVELWN